MNEQEQDGGCDCSGARKPHKCVAVVSRTGEGMSTVTRHSVNGKWKTKASVAQEAFLHLQIQRDADLSSSRALTCSILSLHPLFADAECVRDSQSDRTFLSWKEKGVPSIGDLFIDNVFASFAQLRQKFGLPSSHFFRYLKVRNYVKKSNISNFEV